MNKSKSSGNFKQYLLGSSFSSFAMGIQTLLFPWLVVGELGEAPDASGFAIMLSMLPASFLLLWGGAFSDGRHLGNLLLRLYSLFLVPYVALMVGFYWFGLSYKVVLLFGVGFGVVNSFIQPAREALLGSVARPPLQKAVAKAMIAQSLGMGAGALLGGVLLKYSLLAVVVVQVVLFITAGLLMRRCSPDLVENTVATKTSMGDVVSGLSFAWHSPLLRNLMLMVGVTGFLGFGFYFVMLPLMTREMYQADASFLAGLQAAFVLGGVFVSLLVVRWFSGFTYPGRILIIVTIIRGLMLFFISLGLPVWLIFLSIFAWGVMSSFSAILGRTMVQEYAPEAFRARLISIYQLALFGVGPFGALFGGVLIDQLGIQVATATLGIVTVLLGAIFVLSNNRLWQKLPLKAVSKSD